MSGAPMRKATPRGQMTRGNNSGPAVMLMPPDIRSTFMPNPPLHPVPPLTYRRKQKWSTITDVLSRALEELKQRSSTSTKNSIDVDPKQSPAENATVPPPLTLSEQNKQAKMKQHQAELQPRIIEYRNEQRECKGEFKGMNCYNTLFVGRLAYEVTERKLLREMEAFGPVKDIQIIKKVAQVPTGSESASPSPLSRGYAFVEYEHEEDMKRAYRAADGMRVDGREIVVDVERGHTVPDWLPRRLGGGLGATRVGGRHVNITRPGRFDPNRSSHGPMTTPVMSQPPSSSSSSYGGGGGGGGGGGMMAPQSMNDMGRGSGGGGPPYGGGGGYGGGSGGGYGTNDRFGGQGRAPPPPSSSGDWDRRGGGGGDYDRNKRRRSRSPPVDQQRYGSGARRGRY